MPYIKKTDLGYDFNRWKPEDWFNWEQVKDDDPRIQEALYPEKYNLEYFKSLVQKKIDKLLKESNDYLIEDITLSCSKDEVLLYRKELREFSVNNIPENGIDGIEFPIDPTKL